MLEKLWDIWKLEYLQETENTYILSSFKINEENKKICYNPGSDNYTNSDV